MSCQPEIFYFPLEEGGVRILEGLDLHLIVMCAFIPFPATEGLIIFGDFRGSTLLSQAQTSQEGMCGRHHQDISVRTRRGRPR